MSKSQAQENTAKAAEKAQAVSHTASNAKNAPVPASEDGVVVSAEETIPLEAGEEGIEIAMLEETAPDVEPAAGEGESAEPDSPQAAQEAQEAQEAVLSEGISFGQVSVQQAFVETLLLTDSFDFLPDDEEKETHDNPLFSLTNDYTRSGMIFTEMGNQTSGPLDTPVANHPPAGDNNNEPEIPPNPHGNGDDVSPEPAKNFKFFNVLNYDPTPGNDMGYDQGFIFVHPSKYGININNYPKGEISESLRNWMKDYLYKSLFEGSLSKRYDSPEDVTEIISIDMEFYPVDVYNDRTVEDNFDSIEKLKMYADITREVFPNAQIGFFRILPEINYGQFIHNSTEAIEKWHALNEYLQGLAEHVDVVSPVLYVNNIHENYEKWELYAQEKINESLQYGKIITPYLAFQYHPAVGNGMQMLDLDYWKKILVFMNNHPDVHSVAVWGQADVPPLREWEEWEVLNKAIMDDLRAGGDASSIITGTRNTETLESLDGQDSLIFGDVGDDTIVLHAGDHKAYGGAGADTFIIASAEGLKTLAGFNAAEGDRIDLSQIIDTPLTTANIGRYVRFSGEEGHKILEVSATGQPGDFNAATDLTGAALPDNVADIIANVIEPAKDFKFFNLIYGYEQPVAKTGYDTGAIFVHPSKFGININNYPKGEISEGLRSWMKNYLIEHFFKPVLGSRYDSPEDVTEIVSIEMEYYDVHVYGDRQVEDNYEEVQKLIFFAELAREIFPNAQIGFFRILPEINYAQFIYNTTAYIEKWHALNEYLQVLAEHVDVVSPMLYVNDIYQTYEKWERYAQEKINESLQYGKLIMPYIAPQYDPAAGNNMKMLDLDYWKKILVFMNNHPDVHSVTVWGEKHRSPAQEWQEWEVLNKAVMEDLRTGGDASSIIAGTRNKETLESLDGQDSLIFGDVGDDTIVLHAGDHKAYGGAGADTFIIASTEGLKTIGGFNAAEGDRIDISQVLSVSAENDDILNHVRLMSDGDRRSLEISPTGNAQDFTAVAIVDNAGLSTNILDLIRTGTLIIE